MNIETLKTHSTEEPRLVLLVKLESSWMDQILNYLTTEALSEDKFTAHKVIHQAPHYVLYDGKLYNRSLILPLLKCLLPFEMDYALREVHEGIYGNHLGG